MICKELKIPINIDKSQELLWRLPLNHQKIPIVEKDLKKKKQVSTVNQPSTTTSVS
ncbi:hypothetical protein [Rossellomorea aquimaris]|uniref:hypothetical protein n=1 Tax=Rossellomorea aquimaris TaxID=189382 RepID=UPI002494B2C0|nr:hypothetical protein [Rossellomorea aquimaris]